MIQELESKLDKHTAALLAAKANLVTAMHRGEDVQVQVAVYKNLLLNFIDETYHGTK